MICVEFCVPFWFVFTEEAVAWKRSRAVVAGLWRGLFFCSPAALLSVQGEAKECSSSPHRGCMGKVGVCDKPPLAKRGLASSMWCEGGRLRGVLLLFEFEDAFCSFSRIAGETAFLCLDGPGHSAGV